MLATESKLPAPTGAEKRAFVRQMFAAIAPRYDLLNHLLSLNIDRRWRRQAVRTLEWSTRPAGRYLDLCAGTLDLARELATQPGFAGSVIGADFVLPMLKLGRHKATRVLPACADALELPFPAASFDGLMVGFGIRNVVELDQALREAGRVLKPGARVVILEFSVPRSRLLRALYFLYFRRVLPLIGRVVSKHGSAYSYLPDSVLAFPGPAALAERLRAAHFVDVRYDLLLGGICAVHAGVKPGSLTPHS